MEFRFETDYNLETLTAMAKGLRQTVRKKRSRRTRIFAGIVLAIGLVSTALSIVSKEPLRARNLLVPLAMLNVIYASLQEDRLNGRVAKRNVLPGTEHAGCVFGEDGYTIKTSVTESKFSYAQIRTVAAGIRRRNSASDTTPRIVLYKNGFPMSCHAIQNSGILSSM